MIRSTKTFELLTPDNRIISKNEKTGEILKDEADGYRLETRGGTEEVKGDELWIVFDRAPAFEVRVSVCGLGRKVGDAFKILPASPAIRKKIFEKGPASLRKPGAKDATEMDAVEAARLTFQELVVDWSNVTGGDGATLPCDEVHKKLFLEQKDAMFFAMFVSDRAAAIRAEGINSLDTDSSD